MADAIRMRVPDTGRTRVICRSGNSLARADLELVSPDTATSIMVLPPVGDDSDIDVIKVLLLLNHRTWTGATRPNIVAAVQDSDNLPAARLAAGRTALVIDADDIAVRLIAQWHRQRGLSSIFNELLSFVGNEFHLRGVPALAGTTSGEALCAYELGVPAGLRRSTGQVQLNPAMDTVIAPRRPADRRRGGTLVGHGMLVFDKWPLCWPSSASSPANPGAPARGAWSLQGRLWGHGTVNQQTSPESGNWDRCRTWAAIRARASAFSRRHGRKGSSA
ncbi:hypothetical protein [Streptomyces sp. NPDC088260]|uniref:CASTOR/POLLUX-related putative ion channel n=1 Tax=Streptomyces sp. NPDC088260 TaxID=3365850 RepID=UPI00381B286F